MPALFSSFFAPPRRKRILTLSLSTPLVIRNITSTPIELILVEHIEASNPQTELARIPGGFATGLASITQSVSNLVTNQTSTPYGPTVDPDAKPLDKYEVSIKVGPFKVNETDIKTTSTSENEVIRLTFEVAGQRYKITCPSPKDDSQEFTPVAPNPKFHLTGVFLPQASQLTVFSSSNLHSWMQHLHDDLPLSALSMPGTHNSPTCHPALPSVRCQSCEIPEQLENGVRFFDIRVQVENPKSDKLQLVHGVFPISFTGAKYFRDLLNETIAYLDKNPSETIVMSVKREGPGNGTDEQLAKILYDHYCGPQAPDKQKWYTKPKIPSLGEARHKIVLMRRFGIGDDVKKAVGGSGWGINAESWADNTPCDTHDQICVQDFYGALETENIDKKIKYAKEQCKRAGDVVIRALLAGAGPVIPNGRAGAGADDNDHDGPHSGRGGLGGGRGGTGDGGRSGHGAHGEQHDDDDNDGAGASGKCPPFYLNFLSASNFWKAGCWPEKIAAKLNPAIVEYLCLRHHLEESGPGSGGTGIVILDWVGYQGDWDIVRCIVGMNAKLIASSS